MIRGFIALCAVLALIHWPLTAKADQPSELSVPISRCFHEKFPVGSGLGVGSKHDIAVNRNLIYASDMLVLGLGDPRRGTAVALGYFLHVANGVVYYEPASGLTKVQREREAKALRYVGLARGRVQAVLAVHGGNGVTAMPVGRLRNPPGLRVVHCASLGQNE